jgi:hypothetical protein
LYIYINVTVSEDLPPHPSDFILPMSTHRANKRPRAEDSEPLDSDNSNSSDSDAILGLSDDNNNNPKTKGKKRYKLDPSNMDDIRSTAFKRLETAPRGSIGIPAIRALLAKSGSSSKFTGASRETNSGLRKAGQGVRGSVSRKTSNTKGKERVAR